MDLPEEFENRYDEILSKKEAIVDEADEDSITEDPDFENEVIDYLISLCDFLLEKFDTNTQVSQGWPMIFKDIESDFDYGENDEYNLLEFEDVDVREIINTDFEEAPEKQDLEDIREELDSALYEDDEGEDLEDDSEQDSEDAEEYDSEDDEPKDSNTAY